MKGAGLVFVAAVLALVATAVADVGVAARGSETGFDYGGTYAAPERAVHAKSVEMRPGDRLVLRPNLAAAPGTIVRYDFHVVNGADRFLLLDGEEPRATYLSIRNMSPYSCCPQGYVHWDRPDDELARRAPRPHLATGPGIEVDMRELETSALDQPERIDLVWVLHYTPNVTVPEDERERRSFESRLESEVSRGHGAAVAFDAAQPTVLAAHVLSWHPIASSLIITFAIVAAFAALAWSVGMVGLRPADAPRRLRDALLGAGVVAPAIALHVAIEGGMGQILTILRLAGVGVATSRAAGSALILAYAALSVAWAHALYRAWAASR